MKNYVFGFSSAADYQLRLVKVKAENEYEAIKNGMLELCSEEAKQSEIDWQKSPDYPDNKQDLMDSLEDADIFINVIEI